MLEIRRLFFFFLGENQQAEDEYHEGAEAASHDDEGALGEGFLVGGDGFVDAVFIGDGLVLVDTGLGGTGLKVGELLATVGDELVFPDSVGIGGCEGVDFVLHGAADAVHDFSRVDGALMVDLVAEGVVFGDDVVGDIGGALRVFVEDGDADAHELGALEADVAVVAFGEFIFQMRMVGGDFVDRGEVETLADSFLEGAGVENLERILAVAFTAVVHEVHAVVEAHDGFRQTVGVGGENDGCGFVQRGDGQRDAKRDDGSCHKHYNEPFTPAAEEIQRGGVVVLVDFFLHDIDPIKIKQSSKKRQWLYFIIYSLNIFL